MSRRRGKASPSRRGRGGETLEEPATPPATAPRVFISYAHDDEAHKARVLDLANRLRADGIDAQLDRYIHGSPPEGWPRWMEAMVEWAEFVLVVGSPAYIRRYELREEPGRGLGATWEGAFVRHDLYEAQGRNTKFIPVVFEGARVEKVPKPLRVHTIYRLTDDYPRLLRALTGPPEVTAPPIGGASGLRTDIRTVERGAPSERDEIEHRFELLRRQRDLISEFRGGPLRQWEAAAGGAKFTASQDREAAARRMQTWLRRHEPELPTPEVRAAIQGACEDADRPPLRDLQAMKALITDTPKAALHREHGAVLNRWQHASDDELLEAARSLPTRVRS